MSACAPAPEIGAHRESLRDGFRGGTAAVVMLTHREAATLCTATLVAPRVVLTAKHCVQPPGATAPHATDGFRVVVGEDSARGLETLRVDAVHAPPGVLPDPRAPGPISTDDVALLVLERAPRDAVPHGIHLESPSELVGRTVRLVGYGETPTREAGTKHFVSARVESAGDGTLITRGIACPGDSGGPMLLDDGTVAAVVSIGADACEREGAATVFVALQRHRTWIESVLAAAPSCSNGSAEVCNGLDDDCDGNTDEGCAAGGDACDEDAECPIGTACLESGDGRTCTRRCRLGTGGSDCPLDMRCVVGPSGCTGLCALAEPIGAALGSACGAHAECASGLCDDGRCAAACVIGAGQCLAGEVCSPGTSSACGVCRAPDRGDTGARGLGEPCDTRATCSRGTCEQGRCITPCRERGDCPAGYACDAGGCVPHRAARDGEPCVDAGDCAESLACVEGTCASSCVETCGDGLACALTANEGWRCLAERQPLGASCTGHPECVSRDCVDGLCTASCDSYDRCPRGFECVRSGAGAQCRPPHAGGCSIAVSRVAAPAWPLVALLTVLLARRRAALRR